MTLFKAGGKYMRIAVTVRVVGVLMLICLSPTGNAKTPAPVKEPIHIPPETLDQALRSLATERNLRLVYRSDLVGMLRSSGVSGDLTREEALTEILKGTGLTYRFLDEKTVTIVPPSAQPSTHQKIIKQEMKSSPGRFHLAQVDRGARAESPPVNGPQEPGPETRALKEIIVTAEKSRESLQDTPVPMAVVSADALVNQNQFRLQDYYSEIPGLNVTASSPSGTDISIRGITTTVQSNPTVGITIDGVPYGSSTYTGDGTLVPEIDPSDLARIEVLRGPQGTLWGASSMGGLINYVTVDPSTEAFSGYIQGGTTRVYNGAELGYSVRGAMNLPLTNGLAVRVSGFTRVDPGYVDNPIRHADGVNRSQADGGSFSALWRPSDVFSLKLNALLQEIDEQGSNDVFVGPGFTDLQQNYIPGAGRFHTTLQFYSALMNVKVGWAELTSASGVNLNHLSGTIDSTGGFGGAAAQRFYGTRGSIETDGGYPNKVTQEIRLSGPLGRRLKYLIGAFYTHESEQSESRGGITIFAADPSTGQIVGPLVHLSGGSTYTEYAGFADLTVHLTRRLDVQIGGRESHINRNGLAGAESGPLVGGTIPQDATHASDRAFTYLLTPKLKVSPDLMAYVRLASGYRPAAGGISASGFCVIYHFQCQNFPDYTYDYELGVKADFINHALSVDASVYYIDWRNIQIVVGDKTSHFTYSSNGGAAKSEGVELSIAAKPMRGLNIAAWVARTMPF